MQLYINLIALERLAAANEDILTGALRTAWKLGIEKKATRREKRRALRRHQTRDSGSGDHRRTGHM
jgi:hypothetical protein